MIHAAIFASTDPAARASLLISGGRADIELNTPPGGCWRVVPAGCISAGDVPALGALPIAPAPPVAGLGAGA
jgi:hypothetical protein